MSSDDYRGRLLARAFHDELEKLSALGGGGVGTISTPPGSAPPYANASRTAKIGGQPGPMPKAPGKVVPSIPSVKSPLSLNSTAGMPAAKPVAPLSPQG